YGGERLKLGRPEGGVVLRVPAGASSAKPVSREIFVIRERDIATSSRPGYFEQRSLAVTRSLLRSLCVAAWLAAIMVFGHGGAAACDCHGASQGVLPGSRDDLVRQVIGAFEAAARTPGVTAGAASESRRDPCNSAEVARIRAALDRLQA